MIKNHIKSTDVDFKSTILPIEERLEQINNTHNSMVVILQKIKTNVIQSRRNKPWESPRWKSAKITAQHIEEIGLLTRLGEEGSKESVNEMMSLIDILMGYYQNGSLQKETGDYFELFLSETAIALIYAIEYFSIFLSDKQYQKLSKYLENTADSLWSLILESQVYDERTQSRLAWNHSQFVHAALGMCAMKVGNEQSEERLSRAILWIEGYLSHSFTWDGFSREGVFYAGATRMPLLLFLMALKRNKSIDFLHHSSLINHHQYLINEWVPGSTKFISRNDINHITYATTLSSLLVYADIYQCEKTLTLWEVVAGEKGDQTYGNPSSESNRNGSLVLNYLFYPTKLKPLKSLSSCVDLFKVYREAGVVVGFSKESNFKYSFQASSHLGEIHSQSDHGQIYLYLNGETLLGDASVGNTRELNTPGQAEGHNTLLIDGKGMSISGAGWQSCSILEDAKSHGDYHSMRANLTPAYNANHSRVTLTQYKRLVIVHNAEPYHIVVLDSLSDFHKSQHEFSYRFHTDSQNSICAEEGIIEVAAQHSKMEIIPLGLDWEFQGEKTFSFKNEVRSKYCDASFLANDFLGGYVLIPTSKIATVKVEYEKNQVIINSTTNKSLITLMPNNKKMLLKCQTVCIGEQESKPYIVVGQEPDGLAELITEIKI